MASFIRFRLFFIVAIHVGYTNALNSIQFKPGVKKAADSQRVQASFNAKGAVTLEEKPSHPRRHSTLYYGVKHVVRNVEEMVGLRTSGLEKHHSAKAMRRQP